MFIRFNVITNTYNYNFYLKYFSDNSIMGISERKDGSIPSKVIRINIRETSGV